MNGSRAEGSPLLALAADTQQALAIWAEPVAGVVRVVGWQAHPLERGRALVPALAESCRELGERLGRPLWDTGMGRPLHADPAAPDPLGLGGAATVVAGLEPLPPQRVGLVGLTQGQSVAAAAQALAGAPCQVVGRWSAPLPPGEELAQELHRAGVEVLVVCGGFAGAGPLLEGALLALAETVGQALALWPGPERPRLIYAGNQALADPVRAVWAAKLGPDPATVVGNVLPAPGGTGNPELAVALSQHYWRACLSLDEAQTVARWLNPPSLPLRSLTWGFAQAVRLWRVLHGLPALHGLRATGELWLHVLVEEGVEEDRVQVAFTPAGSLSPLADAWPRVRLVSGGWPGALGPRAGDVWWDPEGLVSALSVAGAVDLRLAVDLLWSWLEG